MSSHVVLLSGGLDSVVNLYLAYKEGRVITALTFDYGQRAAASEIRSARYFSEELDIPHRVIEISWLKNLTKTALVDKTQILPNLRDLDDMVEAHHCAKAVWVPNRNGVFINVAAAFAESSGAEFIVPGFNREEAATFPDNSEAFIKASNEALALSTLSKVKVKCFTADFDKTDMMKAALDLKLDISRIWSCYESGVSPCGRCESCQRFLRALNANRR